MSDSLQAEMSEMSLEKWPMKKIRSTFINYFTEKHDHVFWPSSPAVPVNDPTLMFANSGTYVSLRVLCF